MMKSFIKNLYWNQYYELRAKGKENSALKNGNILVSVMLFVNLATVFIFLSALIPNLADWFEDVIQDIFGFLSGKAIGMLIASFFIATIYLCVRYTIGTEQYFQNWLKMYLELSSEKQLSLSKKGLWYFFGSLLAVIPAVIMISTL